MKTQNAKFLEQNYKSKTLGKDTVLFVCFLLFYKILQEVVGQEEKKMFVNIFVNLFSESVQSIGPYRQLFKCDELISIFVDFFYCFIFLTRFCFFFFFVLFSFLC